MNEDLKAAYEAVNLIKDKAAYLLKDFEEAIHAIPKERMTKKMRKVSYQAVKLFNALMHDSHVKNQDGLQALVDRVRRLG